MFAKTYLLVALPWVLASALFVPPNQVPDEMTHLLRAAQLAEGGARGLRVSDNSAGGLVDRGVAAFVRQHADWSAPPVGAPAPRFSGALEFAHFPNTVRYPPVLYAPSILALGAGRWLGCRVDTAFYAARLLNGAMAVGLCALAMALAKRGRWFLFTLGLMPMALFEMGSVCQDAGLLGLSLLLAACVTRLPSASPRAYWAMAGIVTLMAGARPPLLGLVLLHALSGWRGLAWKHRLIAPLLCTSAVLGWSAMTAELQVSMRTDVPSSIMPQLMYLAEHPAAVPSILFNTILRPDTNWLKTFIGVLGWLTVPLSTSGYLAGIAALALSIVFCAREPNPLAPRDRWLAVAAVILTFAGMLLTTYLTWTPLGASRVEGIQGRYFYGFLPLVVAIVPAWTANAADPWLSRRVRTVLMAACLLWVVQDAAAASLHAWSRPARARI